MDKPIFALLMGLGGSEAIILLSVGLVLWITSLIVRKAGYSGWWSLVLLVPILNVIMIWSFAFSKWPGHRMQK